MLTWTVATAAAAPLPQVHDTLKTAADYRAYLAQALPSLPADAIEVGRQPACADRPRCRSICQEACMCAICSV